MAAGLALARVCEVRLERRCLAAVAVVALAPIAPIAVLGVGFLLWSMRRFRRARERSAADRRVEDACLEAAEIVAMGLEGGLSVAAAHELARQHGPTEARALLGDLLDEMGRVGVAQALGSSVGPFSGAAHALAAAADAGSAALPALLAFTETEEHRRHTSRIETMRRLPVRLLLPLTLLVLPGFVSMTGAPPDIDSLARLSY